MKMFLQIIIGTTLLTTTLQAQPSQTLRGEVKDLETQTPLVGATVAVISTNPMQGTITDINGAFHIDNVPVGRQTIKISYMGYKEKVYHDIEINSGKELLLDIQLEESVEHLEEVAITARKKDESLNEMAMISSRQFSVEETGRYAGSRNDVSRMAMNYAGVTGGDDSRNDIIIRGNSPSGLLWRFNDLDIPDPNHFSGMSTNGGPVSMLNYNVLENSDFITAAFPSEYGNGLSGVFDIKMRKGNNEKREYMFQMGAMGTEAMMEGPFSKDYNGSYLLNYRFSTTSILTAMGIDFGYDGKADYQDLAYNIHTPLKNGSIISLFGMWGNSIYAVNMEDREEGSFDPMGSNTNSKYITSSSAFGASYFYPLNSNTYIKSIVGMSGESETGRVDSINTQNSTEIPYYQTTNSSRTYSWHTYIKHRVNAKNKVKMGFQIKNMIYNIDEAEYSQDYNQLLDTRTSDGQTRLGQLYGEWKHMPTDNIQLLAGIFTQQLYLNNKYSIEPRFGARWQFAPRQSVNLGYGRHSQTHILQIYFFNTQIGDNIYHTNKNLDFSKSDHFVIGYSTLLFENTNFKIEEYYQRLFNIPVHPESYPSSFSLLNEGNSYFVSDEDSLVNNGVGRNYGIELTLEKFFSKGYYYLFTTSLYKSEYQGSDKVWRNTAFDGNYVINLLAGREFALNNKSKLILDLKATTAGGRRYSPINLERTFQAGEIVEDDKKAFSLQHDPYFRMDAKITYRVNRSNTAHEFFINIDNVLNNKNVFTQYFNTTTMSIENIYQLGIFPTFQYKLYF